MNVLHLDLDEDVLAGLYILFSIQHLNILHNVIGRKVDVAEDMERRYG